MSATRSKPDVATLPVAMYEGFDRSKRQASYFERRPVLGYGTAVLLYALAIAWGLSQEPSEKAVEVALEAEIKDLAADSEPPPEEPFDEPPPAPEDVPVERVTTPRPRPRRIPPTERPTEAPTTSDTAKAVEVPVGGSGHGRGNGTRPAGNGPRKKPPEPPPASKKPAKKKRKVRRIADRPAEASPPKPNPNNPVPVYPAAMRAQGVTGVVVLKLKIDATGKVRGAQILRVENDATDEEDKKRFDVLMKKAVIAAVRRWQYTPAMLDGKPIETGHMVTIPFRLTS